MVQEATSFFCPIVLLFVYFPHTPIPSFSFPLLSPNSYFLWNSHDLSLQNLLTPFSAACLCQCVELSAGGWTASQGLHPELKLILLPSSHFDNFSSTRRREFKNSSPYKLGFWLASSSAGHTQAFTGAVNSFVQ